MLYVFEDNRKEKECELYDQMYPIDISSKFIYAESNTLIQYELDKISNKSSEDVVVFLDIVPDNPKTISLYKQLVKNVGKFKTFIIMPIPCREYYYIKQLRHSQVVKNSVWIEEALQRMPYKNQQLLKDQTEAKKCRTFEKFCKRVAYRAFKYCVIKDGIYFDKECLCNDSSNLDFNSECKCESIKDKKQRYLAAFPCFPSGNILFKGNTLQWEDMVRIHKELVCEHNKQVEEFRKCEKNSQYLQKYQKIKPMY